MRSSAVAAALAFAVTLACTDAREANAQRPAAPKPAPKPPPDIELADGFIDASWRQILMAPRITGNLRAVAVDPSDPKNIYVGTEEGTLVHSSDGGITWDETEISPLTMQSPSANIKVGYDTNVLAPFAGYHYRVGDRYYPWSVLGLPSAEIAQPPTVAPRFPARLPPFFIIPFGFAWTPEKLLDQVARDPRPYEEIRRVRVCPGGTNILFVLTASGKLWGSPDATTFVPLYFGRDVSALLDVACSPADPNLVVLATADGTYRSTDGGSSFDLMPGPLGGVGSSSVTFGPSGGAGKAPLYVASGGDLWFGESSDPEAMKATSVGSEGEITHVAATEKSIWVATASGVRVSRDGGTTFAGIDDLEGFPWIHVAIGTAGDGAEHVAVMNEGIAFESVDGGKTFHPFYRAESRRRLRQIVAAPAPRKAPRFFLVTSGELWSTSVSDQGGDANTDATKRWAQQRLKNMPSQEVMLQAALAHAKLTDADISALESGLRKRAWLPSIRLSGGMTDVYRITTRTTTITTPTRADFVDANRAFYVFAHAIWELPDIAAPTYAFIPVRKDLYQIRKRLEFVVEDAYDERKQVLTQMATAPLDAEQLLALQSRLEILDVVLAEFTGGNP